MSAQFFALLLGQVHAVPMQLNQTSNQNTTSEILDTPNIYPLTAAAIFGMFLAVQFCQLTQPYGSLLFHKTAGHGAAHQSHHSRKVA